jgi:hypothetical protein
MPNENDLILSHLKRPSLEGNVGHHDSEFFNPKSMYDLYPFPETHDFASRLDPNEVDSIEDRRGWSPLWGKLNTVWDTNSREIGNLLKYGLGASKWPVLSDEGGKLSGDAGYYDIGS